MRSSLTAALAAALTFAPALDARAATDDCQATYSKLLATAARSRDAQDHVAAADCAVKLNKIDDAISHYRKAIDGALDADERNEALKALAYQLETRERWQEAAEAWAKAAALKNEPESRLGVARVALQRGDASRTAAMLATIDPQRLERPLQAEYWSLKAQTLKEADPAGALDAINRAIAIEDVVYRRVERADLLLKLGRRREAIADLEYAHRAEPSNASTARSLAYALNDDGRYGDAAAMFDEASRADPTSSDELEDWGYALLAAGRRDEAVEKFRHFIDVRSAQAKSREDALIDSRLWSARRQIHEIEHDFYASAFFTYRSDAGLPAALLSEQSSLQSSFGAEVGWRAFGLDRPGDLTLFASTYFALTDGLDLDHDSPQGAIGARWQPIAEHEFFLSLIRLVELGDASREGWLTQVSFAASEGGDWDPAKSHWFFASIEAYANYLLDEPHFFSAAVEGRVGETFGLAQLLTLTPHVLLAGETTEDNGSKSSLVEAGGGVSLQHWFCDDHYAGPLCTADLTFQYRRILARQGLGNGDNAVVVSMTVGL